jgi:hypothetical protein
MLLKMLNGDGELLESEAETGGVWIAGFSLWLVSDVAFESWRRLIHKDLMCESEITIL